MIDITFSIEGKNCIFKAITQEGEMWMGSPQIVLPLEDGKEYRETATRAGLSIPEFPIPAELLRLAQIVSLTRREKPMATFIRPYRRIVYRVVQYQYHEKIIRPPLAWGQKHPALAVTLALGVAFGVYYIFAV